MPENNSMILTLCHMTPGNRPPSSALPRSRSSTSNSLDDAPVGTTTPLAELRRRFARPLPDEGADPVSVIDELARGTAGGLLGSAGGRFYGWVIGGRPPRRPRRRLAHRDLGPERRALRLWSRRPRWSRRSAAPGSRTCSALPGVGVVRAGDRLPDGPRHLPGRGPP